MKYSYAMDRRIKLISSLVGFRYSKIEGWKHKVPVIVIQCSSLSEVKFRNWFCLLFRDENYKNIGN